MWNCNFIFGIYNNHFDLLINYNEISNFLMNFKKEKCEVQSKYIFWGKYSLIEVLLKLMNLHGHSKGFH
jgi:hypothetical protein